jgi:hypothetical protein
MQTLGGTSRIGLALRRTSAIPVCELPLSGATVDSFTALARAAFSQSHSMRPA